MSLETTVKVSIQAVLRRESGLGVAQDPLAVARTASLASGTGADQADRSFHDQRTLAAEGAEELDLAAGLADALGQEVGLARVKVVYVKNLSAEDCLLVGGAAEGGLALFAGATDRLVVRPGGVLLFTAPDADGVPADGGAVLRLAHGGPGGEDLEYELVVIGASS